MTLPPIHPSQYANNLKCYSGNQNELGYVVNTVNKVRKDNGLKELTRNQKLNLTASMKAKDMADRKYWSHEDPDGKLPGLLADSVGYDYGKMGENLAKKMGNARTVEAWMKSPTHLKNILNPEFKDIGLGEAEKIKVLHLGRERKR